MENRNLILFIFLIFLACSDLLSKETDFSEEQIISKNIGLRKINVNYKNEILKYKIFWKIIPAGEAEMGIETTELYKYKVYHIYTNTKSNKSLDLIYKVRNRTDSYVDIDGFYSLKFVKDQNEAGYVSHDEVVFNHVDNFWYYLSDKTTSYIPTFVQDVVSSLYWLRLQNIEVGKKYTFQVWVGKVVYPMIVNVIKVCKVKVFDKEYECFKVEPIVDIQSFPLFRARGRLFVYITTDERKLPVRLESKVFIGRVFADLESYYVK